MLEQHSHNILILKIGKILHENWGKRIWKILISVRFLGYGICSWNEMKFWNIFPGKIISVPMVFLSPWKFHVLLRYSKTYFDAFLSWKNRMYSIRFSFSGKLDEFFLRNYVRKKTKKNYVNKLSNCHLQRLHQVY